jgi:hypothetical protein
MTLTVEATPKIPLFGVRAKAREFAAEIDRPALLR